MACHNAPCRIASTPGRPIGETCRRHRQRDEQQAGHDVRGEVVGGGGLDLRGPYRVDGAEHRDQSAVLLQCDEIVEQRRRHPARRLRQHHQSHRAPIVEAKGFGGGQLRRMDRLDARPEDLGHVGGVDQHQRETTEQHRVRRNARQPQPRQAEPDEVQADQQGQARGTGRRTRLPTPATETTPGRAASAPRPGPVRRSGSAPGRPRAPGR